MIRISIALVAVLSFTACSKKKEGEGGGGGGDKPAALKLPKSDNLTIDVPGEATVGDGIMGDGNMIQGEAVGALTIEPDKKPQTLDEAKSDAGMYSPKNLKGEALPDGWTLTFDNTGSMGANYFVTVRRDIGGKTYKCSTTTGDANQAKGALAACKTLRK